MSDQPEPEDPTPDEPTPQEVPGGQQQPAPEGTPAPQESPVASQGVVDAADTAGTPLARTPHLAFYYPPVTGTQPTPGADQAASVVTHTYDAFGTLIGTTAQDPFGQDITYTYDLEGNRFEPPAPLP